MVVFTLYEHGYILDWEYVFLCIIENIHFYVGYFNISNILAFLQWQKICYMKLRNRAQTNKRQWNQYNTL